MTDSKQELKCPACKETMIKKAIPLNFDIDICQTCGGIWFDNREFEKFCKNIDSLFEIDALIKDNEIKEVNTKLKRKCPVCGHDMVKHFAIPNCDIEIDECYSCGGKFLDYMEINEIIGNLRKNK